MRRVKILLIAALCIVSCLFAGAKWMQIRSGQNVPPEITCSKEILDISVLQGEEVLLSGMSAFDEQDGDLTAKILVGGISKLISDNTAKVTYLVFDSDDNMASFVRTIRYLDYHRPEINVTKAMNFTRDETMEIISHLKAIDVMDGDISDRIRISTLRATNDSNIFSVVAQVTNSMGDTAKMELPVVMMESDPDRPVLYLSEYLTYVEQGSVFNPRSFVRSVSVSGKSVPTSDVVWDSGVDTAVPGVYWVRYSYSSGGKTGMVMQTVVVEPMGGGEVE